MTENNAHADDLSIDGAESEAVTGGRMAWQEEVKRLEHEGYSEGPVTPEGQVMINKKTGHQRVVKNFAG